MDEAHRAEEKRANDYGHEREEHNRPIHIFNIGAVGPDVEHLSENRSGEGLMQVCPAGSLS